MNISDLFGFEQSIEWVTILFLMIFLIGLFFLQKYIYLLDRKFAEYSKKEILKERKPWPLFSGMILGLLCFLYTLLSKNGQPFKLDFKSPFNAILLFVLMAIIIGVIYESIVHFGIKTGIIRSIVYVILMILYFYSGFITGLFLVAIIALGVLIFFLKYFKNLLTIK